MGRISLVLLVIFLLGFICLAPLEARKLLDKEEKHLDDRVPMLKGNLVLHAPPKDTLLPREGLPGLHLVRMVSGSVPSPGAGHVEQRLEPGSSAGGEGHHEDISALHLAHRVSQSFPSAKAGHSERGLESPPSPGAGHDEGLSALLAHGVVGGSNPSPGAGHLEQELADPVPSPGAGHLEQELADPVPSPGAGHLGGKLDSVPSAEAGHDYTFLSLEKIN